MEDKAKESKVLATALRGALKLETTSATPLVSMVYTQIAFSFVTIFALWQNQKVF